MNRDDTQSKAEAIVKTTTSTNSHHSSNSEPAKLSAQDAISLGSLKPIDSKSNINQLKNSTNTITNKQDTSHHNHSKKKKKNNYLNKSNDCLVVDMDDEENIANQSIIDMNDENCGVLSTKKSSKGSKVLFDLKNGVNSNGIVKQPPSTLGNNIRRISSNFSNRITNKQTRFEKRKNSSSSNLAAPQSPSVISSSTEFSKMNSVNNNNNSSNRLRFPLNERIQSVFEIIRARINLTDYPNRALPSSRSQKSSGSKSSSSDPSKLSKSNKPQASTSSKQPLAISKSNGNVDQTQENCTDVASPDICQLCFIQCLAAENKDEPNENYMYSLGSCEHAFCIECLRLYLKYQITESRVLVACPQCNEKMHPNDIYRLLSSNSQFVSSTNMETIPSPNETSKNTTTTATITSSKPTSSDSISNTVSNTNNNNSQLILKYEEFMLRRVLVTIADTRWCPAPDCNYAVIASGCANCPQLYCMRPDCNTSFCYHCKQIWHPNVTCEDAAIQNNQTSIGLLLNSIHIENAQTTTQTSSTSTAGTSNASTNKLIRSLLQRSNSHISIGSSQAGGINNHRAILTTGDLVKEEIKRCPKCQALIVKMDDGSCNHITCAVCGCEFCWLCMKEISDLHYLSPSGCTFWGKKPWSRKKKILWQLGILIGAPVGIALIAGVAIPAILIGLPIWSGRKVYTRYKTLGKHKRNFIVISTVTGTIILAPLVAALAVGIGVPILLAYVYGVVPISLCRSGGCGVTKNNNGGVRFAFDEETADNANFYNYNNGNNTTMNNFSSNSNLAIIQSNTSNNGERKKTSCKNGSNSYTNFDDNSIVLTGLSSVKVPISAIESKPSHLVATNHVNLMSKNSNRTKLASSDTLCDSAQTPVLVTITMANKHHLSTELDNNKGASNNSHKSQSSSKSSKRSKRRSASYAPRKTSSQKKESPGKKQQTSFSVKNGAAENCGTVELLKLTKSMSNFFNEPDLVKNSIASECITGACVSSIVMNNMSDNETNISSSSSSQQLLEVCETNSNNKISTFVANKKREKRLMLKDDEAGKKQMDSVTNPSIGEFSLGAYTMTSRSVSGSNLFDFESKRSRAGIESLAANDEAALSENAESFTARNTSVSNIAIAGHSTSNSIRKEAQSIISEQSMNPSVTALAGSLKDDHSVANLSNVDVEAPVK